LVRIFVTGATGVIGRRVIPLLVGAGHEVTAIGRTPEKRAALGRMGATPVEVDILASAGLRQALAGQDTVINLATHIPPATRMLLPGAWRENDRIRAIASANLVDAALAAGVRRFIQESFALTYPDSRDRWIDESLPIRPARYARSAAEAEAATRRFTQGGGSGVVLRFAAFCGADSGQTRDLIRFIRRGWVLIPGAAGNYFSWVSHDDAASAVAAVLDAAAGIYNVVDDEPMLRRASFDSLAQMLGVPPPRLPPPWLGKLFGSLGEMLARSLRISNRKLREDCGWVLRYPSVREGWRAVVEELSAVRVPAGADRSRRER
jgi:nucleoside-diphosphate-sugar epimerase